MKGLGAYRSVVVVGKVHEASLQIRYPAQVIRDFMLLHYLRVKLFLAWKGAHPDPHPNSRCSLAPDSGALRHLICTTYGLKVVYVRMAHIRQSRSDYGLGLKAKVLKPS